MMKTMFCVETIFLTTQKFVLLLSFRFEIQTWNLKSVIIQTLTQTGIPFKCIKSNLIKRFLTEMSLFPGHTQTNGKHFKQTKFQLKTIYL